MSAAEMQKERTGNRPGEGGIGSQDKESKERYASRVACKGRVGKAWDPVREDAAGRDIANSQTSAGNTQAPAKSAVRTL